MQAMTDEDCRTIAVEIHKAATFTDTLEQNLLAEGRAAVALAAPYLLAEPTDAEVKAASDFAPCQPFLAIRKAFANRLALYTVKPDPRREAVLDELNAYLIGAAPSLPVEAVADRIIARIDAAGGKQ